MAGRCSRYVLNGAKMWITNGTVDGKETGDAYLVRWVGGWRDGRDTYGKGAVYVYTYVKIHRYLK